MPVVKVGPPRTTSAAAPPSKAAAAPASPPAGLASTGVPTWVPMTTVVGVLMLAIGGLCTVAGRRGKRT